MEAYNYSVFPEDMDSSAFERFPGLLKVGERAPDAPLTRLSDGARVRLSEYWIGKHLVIEFGSFT